MATIPTSALASPVIEDRFLMFVIDGMANELDKTHDDVIRMTLGKSELPPDAPIVDAMLTAAADYRKASLVYPAGLPQLRERIAREYARRYDVSIPDSQVIVSTGTSAMFRNLHHLLVGVGDEVLVPLPYYPLYVFTARLAGATVTYYRIDPRTLAVDLDSFAAAVSERTRVVVVNSPGNPLGNVVSRDVLRDLDRIVAGRAVIVSDEIYANAYFDDEPFSAVELAAELRSPLVVTNAFSKAHRMYARRVGYAIVPEQLAGPLTVIQHHTLLTTDPVPQFGAIAALDHPEGVDLLVSRYRGRRDYTLKSFADVPLVTALPSRGGFYLTLDCGRFMRHRGITSSLELGERILRTVRVATVPGSDFGLPETLRLSYTSARYEEGIDRLVQFFTNDGRPT